MISTKMTDIQKEAEECGVELAENYPLLIASDKREDLMVLLAVAYIKGYGAGHKKCGDTWLEEMERVKL